MGLPGEVSPTFFCYGNEASFTTLVSSGTDSSCPAQDRDTMLPSLRSNKKLFVKGLCPGDPILSPAILSSFSLDQTFQKQSLALAFHHLSSQPHHLYWQQARCIFTTAKMPSLTSAGWILKNKPLFKVSSTPISPVSEPRPSTGWSWSQLAPRVRFLNLTSRRMC